MNINIGSKNKIKVEALAEMLQEYPDFKDAEVVTLDVESGVSDQPKSLEETMSGAMNRAKNAWHDCKYSFGLESGLMTVPHTKAGYMDFCVCAIYDGIDYHFGFSSAWEVPQPIVDNMINKNMDMNQASKAFGLTDKESIGSAEGLIGVLTKGRLVRKDYTKEAIRTAMINLDK